MAVSLALLTGAASTAISAVLITGIVHCTSRSVEAQYEMADLTMSWIPEFLLQVAALELVSGALLLHTRNLPSEFTAFSTFAVPFLLIALAILSIWARRNISVSIGLHQLAAQDLESQENQKRRLLTKDAAEKESC
ncbi:hypothetical protein AU210_016421 [Fusarium oxysporum f. sp. radicis-cucumerinum]|uniref:Uncharacterized protein n=1 Tax=Fusarium oxysporum f. sp. radicis-cucumerinum TaxID=327505 RepID=A0A2H3G8Q3_FUSOX|nr:hypothetical protein AU210_016723 [Fusarium oxysporum f. sp. radicis-cucumerinum]PCD21459.1 hypothetical protein AU210_016421 [Fusarium oxysporum f. sp. radicis-cucumerinum]